MMKMNATAKVFYSIYYGFRRYVHLSPHIGRRIVAKKLGVPYQNIEIGIYSDSPMWNINTPNWLLIKIGQVMLRLRAHP